MTTASTPTLTDIGVNLTSKQFRGEVPQIIERARVAGVARMVVTGLSAPLSWRAAELAAQYPNTLVSTAGVHPHNVTRCNATTLGELRRLASRKEVVAIGETGLDYNRDFSPRETQRRWFERQLKLAVDACKPVFLHEREAHDDFVEILAGYREALVGGVVHCFTSDGRALDRYLELDLHIGITGYICDDRRGAHLRELVRRIPKNRLMVETDAPFLLPRDLKWHSRRNEPSLLPHVLERVARSRNESPTELAAATSTNATCLFGLDQFGGAVISPSGSVKSTSGSVVSKECSAK